MEDKNKKWVLVGIVVLIVIVIIFIGFFNSNGNYDDEVISCIASRAKLYTTPTCSVCAVQKEDLGKYLDKFEIIDCAVEREICVEKDISKVPAWEVDGEFFVGKRSIEQLKELTGC